MPNLELLSEVSGLLKASSSGRIPKYGPRSGDIRAGAQAASVAGRSAAPPGVELAPGRCYAFLSRLERPAHHFLAVFDVPTVMPGAAQGDDASQGAAEDRAWHDEATHIELVRCRQHFYAMAQGEGSATAMGPLKRGVAVFRAPWRATGLPASPTTPPPAHVATPLASVRAAVLKARPDAQNVQVAYRGLFARVNVSTLLLPLGAAEDPRVSLLQALPQLPQSPAARSQADHVEQGRPREGGAEAATPPTAPGDGQALPPIPPPSSPPSSSLSGGLPPLPGVGGRPPLATPIGAVRRGPPTLSAADASVLEGLVGSTSPPTPSSLPVYTTQQVEDACMRELLQRSLAVAPAQSSAASSGVAVVKTHHLFLAPDGTLVGTPAAPEQQPDAQVLVPGSPLGGVAVAGGVTATPALGSDCGQAVVTQVEFLGVSQQTTWLPGLDPSAGRALPELPLPQLTACSALTLGPHQLAEACALAREKWAQASAAREEK